MRSQRGSVVPMVVACVGVLVLVGIGCAMAAAAVVAHRRAQSAADLAALAGAQSLSRGGDGCAAAGDLAVRNHADLVSCVSTPTSVTVVVEVGVPGRWAGLADVRAKARAGW
ncbi:Rv3654c family TadE-like protein [Nocardioides sp.]|uniref:Rv3654c family TadE-like protein n=1 Tax=Nocardioides sp. TaxID=35761 RepID=UPI00261314C7|nr:Rv3654c family TadE-like protein [Nocardioides sp.]